MILKHSKSKWIELEGFEGKIKIDYPTTEQMETIREIFFQLLYLNPNYTKDDKAPEIKLTFEQEAKEKIIAEKLAKLRIKYSIKDWEGIKDEEGNNVEFKLVNNEMEKDLFESFISNLNYAQMIKLGYKIQDETEFNEADKKK